MTAMFNAGYIESEGDGGKTESYNVVVENKVYVEDIESFNDGNVNVKETEHDRKQSKDQSLSYDILYSVDDVPPFQLTILLGFQQYLTAFGGLVGAPLLLRKVYCIDGDDLGLAHVIGTVLVASGISTIIQTVLGVRLPIIQGTTAAFFGPIISVLSQPDMQCPYLGLDKNNDTAGDLPSLGSDGHKEIWLHRFRVIQGSMLVASLFQIIIGFSGLIGVMLRYIGPLTVTPTISLIGLSLFEIAADFAKGQWYIALSTSLAITIFSQYFKNLTIPCWQYTKGEGCNIIKLPIFQLFPANGVHLSTGAVCGMLAAIIASVVESIADYRACAKLSGAPPPPDHAMNRGITVEGIGCLINAAFGSGQGTTSFSQNIATIVITKVGNRRVTVVAGIFMLIFGFLGKFTALFVALPDPILGGILLVTFAMIISVGLSNLQYVDLNSSRNLFIIGTSIFVGMTVPRWIITNPESINTGVDLLDQILVILLRTSMLVGGILGFILDNTIPGTAAERGLLKWNASQNTKEDKGLGKCSTYDIPWVQKYLSHVHCLERLPICPSYRNNRGKRCKGETS